MSKHINFNRTTCVKTCLPSAHTHALRRVRHPLMDASVTNMLNAAVQKCLAGAVTKDIPMMLNDVSSTQNT